MRVGIAFTPFETRADAILRLAVQADEGGIEAVGVAEGWTHDAIVLLAEIAGRTRRIGIATGVLSVWGRTAATVAMGAAGLQRCSGGRFTLGLGAGSPPLAEGLHGEQWERPVERLRAMLLAVRALLAGERLPAPAGDARPMRLGAPPETPVPIELAALAPPSVRLAGELADGWMPFLWARSRLARGRELLQEGAAGAGRATEVVPGVPVALAPDMGSARRLAAWWLATYTTRMGPLYPRMLAGRFGMATGVAAVVEAGRASRAPELPSAAEELAHETTLLGTYDDAGSIAGAWLAAGADRISLVLPPGRPEEELARIVDVAAQLARAV
jgi:alkanesulfonate monooxygenase SsuD/methylene tetrahydromethanopterin reductase-like flavin-dependent oxidoreductase (luciferase family)